MDVLKRNRRGLAIGALVAADAGSVVLSFAAAYWLRYRAPAIGAPGAGPGFVAYGEAVVLVGAIWVLILSHLGLYQVRRAWRLMDLVATAVAAGVLGMVFFLAASYLLKLFFYSRLLLVYVWAANVGALVASRLALKSALVWLRARGVGVRNLVILGANGTARTLAKTITLHPEAGYRLLGLVEPAGAEGAEPAGAETGFDDPGNVVEGLLARGVDDLVVTMPVGQSEELRELVALCHDRGVRVRLVPDLYDLYSRHLYLEAIETIPLLSFRHGAPAWERAVKRGLDLALAAGGLVVVCVPLGILALLVRRATRGRVLEAQRVVGCGGHPFRVWRFVVPAAGDSRLTRLIRHLLLRYRLRLLPALWSVVRGEMSLVGPRPEPPERVRTYSNWQRRRLLVKPGITGLAQVNELRGFSTRAEREEADLRYVEQQSLGLDARILARTVWVLGWRRARQGNAPAAGMASCCGGPCPGGEGSMGTPSIAGRPLLSRPRLIGGEETSPELAASA